MSLTFDQKLNRTVRHQFAANAKEVAEAVGLLPVAVASGLTLELDGCGEAHRYDVPSECAYSFRSEGNTLTVWMWNGVETSEAGVLLPLIVNLDQCLTEIIANEAFFQATGRRVSEPRAYRGADLWSARISEEETSAILG